jgi:hypothetical protein
VTRVRSPATAFFSFFFYLFYLLVGSGTIEFFCLTRTAQHNDASGLLHTEKKELMIMVKQFKAE